MGGSEVGVNISSAGNTVGGVELGAANTIAFNREEGVRLDRFDSTAGNRILSNSIFDNGALGIDLGGNGSTLNDRKDPDAGPNTLQNFPVLTGVKLSEVATTVEGTLDSIPSTRKKKRSFTIQFFSSPQNEDEGKTFLGQKRVTTDAKGDAAISFGTRKRSSGAVTATATDPDGNTSEFSAPRKVVRKR